MISLLSTGDKLYDAWVGALGFTFIAIFYFIYLKIKAIWQNRSAKKEKEDIAPQIEKVQEVVTTQTDQVITSETSSKPMQTKDKPDSFIFLLDSNNKIAVYFLLLYISIIVFVKILSIPDELILYSPLDENYNIEDIGQLAIYKINDSLIYLFLFSFIVPLVAIGIGNIIYLCTKYRLTHKD